MQLEQTGAALQSPRLAFLVRRFHAGIRRDAAVLGAAVRALSAPRGPARHDVERFEDFVRAIVREELA